MSDPTTPPDENRAIIHTPDVNAEIAESPTATTAERKKRSSLIRQAARFVVLNLKILKLSRQHH